MPELPEVQALAERLSDALAGAMLERIEPYGFSGLKTVTPAPDSVLGNSLEAVGRRGKYLVWSFGGSAPRLLVHLSQGSRVDLEVPAKRTKPRGSVVRFVFADRGACLVKEFGTERKAGWWVIAPADEGPLVRLGPEPDDAAFAALVRGGDDRRRLHTILRDQRTVAGIGRGYTDDALHAAQLSPFASLGSLDAPARERLLTAIDVILADALALERERSGGLPTKMSGRFKVHGHPGEPCPRCGADLRRVSFESYEIVYCPACQTGGKILADRRMSRLLR